MKAIHWAHGHEPRDLDTGTTIEVPFGVQVYTHGSCQTQWDAPVCSCGKYRLHWQMKATAYDMDTLGQSLTTIPGNERILAMLADAIEGPYALQHHYLQSWIDVRPQHRTRPVTIHATPGVHLWGGAKYRTLKGTEAMRLLIWAPDEATWRAGGEILVEGGDPAKLSLPEMKQQAASKLDELPRATPQPKPPPKPVVNHQPKRKPARAPIIDTPAPVSSPPVRALPPLMQERIETFLTRLATEPLSQDLKILEDLRHQEDVRPLEGDYIVIPTTAVKGHEELPPWVVKTSAVKRVHIHKPRRGGDQPPRVDPRDNEVKVV